MSDGATTMKSKLQIGLIYLGITALSVFGGVTLRGGINTVPVPGTSTGTTLQTNGVTDRGYVTVPLTMTGGLSAYNLAEIRMPTRSTGAVLGAFVQWVYAPKVISYDVGFSACAGTGTGSVFSGLNNKSSGTGSFATFVAGSGGLAVPRWDGSACIVMKSLTSGGPTSSGSGYLTIEYMDDRSE